jgi:hypothetical protein
MITLCFPNTQTVELCADKTQMLGTTITAGNRGAMNFVTAYAENSCQHKDPAMLWLAFGSRVLCKALATPCPKDRVSISFLVN